MATKKTKKAAAKTKAGKAAKSVKSAKSAKSAKTAKTKAAGKTKSKPGAKAAKKTSAKAPGKKTAKKAVAKKKGVAKKAAPKKASQKKPAGKKAAAKKAAAKKPAAKKPAAKKPKAKKPAPKAAAGTKAETKKRAAADTATGPKSKSAATAKPAKKPATAQKAPKPAPAPGKAAEAKPEPQPVEKKEPPKPVKVFKVNDYIVYPTHGVGQIVNIEEREIAGTKLELYVISFEQDKMTLRVPTGKVDAVGMRDLSSPDIVQTALKTLKGRARIKRTMWSRRAQEYEAKINSGDLISIAEVVRDLHRADGQPEQSYSERQLYEAALDRLTREVGAVESLDEQQAAERIEKALTKSAA